MTETKPETQFAMNRVNLLVLAGDFNLRLIVEELIKIEAKSGYEFALHVAAGLNYEALCELAEVGGPDNDPNQVPTRFFILPGADDAALEINQCLDAYPYPLHPATPSIISVALLQSMLDLSMDAESGDNDATIPMFNSREDQDNKREVFDANLLEKFKKYLLNRTAKPENQKEKTHTVKSGESLSAISKQYKLSSWQILWKANQKIVPNPDVIHPGQILRVPSLDHSDMESWIKDKDEPGEQWQQGLHYQFPADYLSLTIVDGQGKPEENLPEQNFEVYYATDRAQLVYRIPVKQHDDIQILVPDRDDVSWGLVNRVARADSRLSMDRAAWLERSAALKISNEAAEDSAKTPPKPDFPSYRHDLDDEE